MSDQPMKEVAQQQAKQIELLKQQLIQAGKDRDRQEAWVRRHENHLGEVRIRLTHLLCSLDIEKIKATEAGDWLLTEAYRDDYDVE